ncbi:vegetative cell wall protein gp1-like [Olea europaea var. sylvestris]|uniref:vegetative cell wall protein gp1-like n=1 Tax=Olea europaea var. sylvestris TaxID=158386 RepID=UPI000C1D6A8D|nr:vegetative cell wall protein gp1-like [Olea europaea var. sylvestris]
MRINFKFSTAGRSLVVGSLFYTCPHIATFLYNMQFISAAAKTLTVSPNMSPPFAISSTRKSIPLYASSSRALLSSQSFNKNLKQPCNDGSVKSPLEMTESPFLPISDLVPQERPSDPPPLSPGSNPGPEFPIPPHPSAPVPEAPRPPSPSPPGYPEIFPPHAPDITPPEPGPPPPRKPKIMPSPIIV